MSRPRTPTHILEMRGAFKKNPARGLARAASADNYFSREQRPPFPPMPAKFRPLSGVETTKSKRLREIWETIERRTRQVELHQDNFKKLPFVCELLWKCRYGRPSAENVALAGRWLAAFRMDPSFANKVTSGLP
jgi:hypothetical protein